jgi:hypothetical protein
MPKWQDFAKPMMRGNKRRRPQAPGKRSRKSGVGAPQVNGTLSGLFRVFKSLSAGVRPQAARTAIGGRSSWDAPWANARRGRSCCVCIPPRSGTARWRVDVRWRIGPASWPDKSPEPAQTWRVIPVCKTDKSAPSPFRPRRTKAGMHISTGSGMDRTVIDCAALQQILLLRTKPAPKTANK